MAERLRAFLQEVRPEKALVVMAVLLAVSLLALSVAVIWFGVLYYRQQAAETETAREGSTTPQEETWAENFPLVFDPGPSGLAESTSADGRSPGIPGLSSVDVVANLGHLSGTDFRCTGSTPGRGLIRQVCRSSSAGDDPASYEVVIMSQSAVSVRSVQATAYEATEEEAAEVLGYVANTSLEETNPVNAESWVRRSVSSGGQYSADGVELRLYGTKASRTLEIVATGPPASRVPETTLPSSTVRQPTSTVPLPTVPAPK